MELHCKNYGHFDLVVVGGGCTGLFAAVRAARLGLKAAVVEQSGCFGGMATNGLVNVWHSLYDSFGSRQIIGGLTGELETAMLKSGNAAAENSDAIGIRFNPNALKIELDRLAAEAGVKAFLHTFYASLTADGDRIRSVIAANKDGLGELTADFFIDATGDGDLCRDAGLACYTMPSPQPPSPTCLMRGDIRGDLGTLIRDHGRAYGLEDDWGWGGDVPGLEGIQFRADFHLSGKLCSQAAELTEAEMLGRQKIHRLELLLKQYDNPDIAVAAYGSYLGVRDTLHFETKFRAVEWDLLTGKVYDNTVMRGTYRVDIHHQHDNGITFKYLDGRCETFYGKSGKPICGNWRAEAGLSGPHAAYYQLPFEIMVQTKMRNLIPAGRMIHADAGAFGALRVMVNLNQLGEAAGVGAYLAVRQRKAVWEVSGKDVEALL